MGDGYYLYSHESRFYVPCRRAWTGTAVKFCPGGYLNTMDSNFCVEALHEALDRYGRPEIFNTDQGSQLTSKDFTEIPKKTMLKSAWRVAVAAMTNIFIERLRWTIKYQYLYRHSFENGLWRL